MVLGASGMLGNAVFRFFSQNSNHNVIGTLRSAASLRFFAEELHSNLIINVEADNQDSLIETFSIVRPDLVINCIGLVKQMPQAKDAMLTIPLNALLPHRLAKLCQMSGARLIHISTDCVFSGSRGMYKETDFADADDLYGRSKLLGEVFYNNAVTLRTSIIGHELNGKKSLVDWFLAQEGTVKGYKKAIFSGLPTVEIARIIRDFIIPNTNMRGLYHLSAEPINKFELLALIASIYKKNINIYPDEEVSIDRSLDSSGFRELAGYVPPAWNELIAAMKNFR